MTIKDLKPGLVWKHFYALTQIPRPSKNEHKAVDYVYQFGEKNKLETLKDDAGNVIIRKLATPGYENRKGVILQGHLDMVPQKNEGVDHNFDKDPIITQIQDEYVTAQNTTLGADNGIGVASALAVLEDKDLQHGPLEVLFTVDEETGMTGAFQLASDLLKGDVLINTDTETEGEVYMGCAGGVDADVHAQYNLLTTDQPHKGVSLSVTGLKGGHSGMDIHLGRGNANKILFRVIKKLTEKFNVNISAVHGGSLRNAIPREAFADLLVPDIDFEEANQEVVRLYSEIEAELKMVEPDLKITFEEKKLMPMCMNPENQEVLIDFMYSCPTGVIRMSDEIPGMVETSINLASITVENGDIKVICLLRSAVDSAKDYLADQVESICKLAGYGVTFTGDYPGWRPNSDSEILAVSKKVYKNLYGSEPAVMAVHAGLECGILGAKYPDWDMISIGPTIDFPHSPDERVHIESVQKYWEFLVKLLENIPQK